MDLISRQDAIAVLSILADKMDSTGKTVMEQAVEVIRDLRSAQKTAKRIVGCDRNGMTMWYQCDMCHEPVDEKDTFCRGCGRRFEDE